MMRWSIVFALALSGCGGSPAPEPASPSPPDPGPPAIAPEPAPASSALQSEAGFAEPPAASREERQQRVRQLLEGRVPEPDLPTDSGG